MKRLSVITLTGARPEAFWLCAEYFHRQTIHQNKKISVEWIVVDDVNDETLSNLSTPNYSIKFVNPTPKWTPDSSNTFVRNLKAALEQVTGDVVCFMEDDDWYASDYLEWVVANHVIDNTGNMALGESFSKYYNVYWRKSNEREYKTYAALAQTSFSVGLIPHLLHILDKYKDNHDMHFWLELPEETFSCLYPTIFPHVIGIKGMPGRLGIGRGHKKVEQQNWFKDDKNFGTLINYLGVSDAQPYIKIMKKYQEAKNGESAIS